MRPIPLLGRIAPSTVSVIMCLCLWMGVGVVLLLLVLMRWAHGMGLRVLLTLHVVGIGSPSLLVVGNVVRRIVEGVNGLIVIRVVSG